jgi:transcriptional regulator with GAF, ATPase, and Fis domain
VPVLLALFGPKRGVRLEIGEAGAVLGRSSEADLQLIDGKVSRQHCRFSVEPGGGGALSVEDLGSHNGTYVNGERAEGPRALAPGDEIAVGDSLFVVDADGGGDVAPARFGDATLVVAPGAPVVEPPAPSAGSAGGGVGRAAALAAELARCPDLESAARAVLAAMEQALDPRRAFVLAWDGARGLPKPLVGRSEGAAVSVSRTVLELAARRRHAIVLEDAVEDRELGQARSVVRHQLRAVLVAPILDAAASGGVIGFLHADRPGPPYRPDDAELLDCFAALFALHQRRADGGQRAPGSGSDQAGAVDRGLSGTSPALRAALRTAEAAAGTPSTVLITGESGTGKEEIARFIHARSPRARGPFVAVNCGAVPEGIAESELFGHERGAFTGAGGARAGKIEAADGGTLFLDEVGELPPAIQVKLLRVLQERAFYRVGSTVLRRVDLRVVAATHRDLDAAVRERRFRDDLFYRLAVIRLHLPPLRDRPDDVEPLARALLARVAAAIGRADPGLTPGALAALRRWPWPGNARELGNVLERALVLRALPAGAAGPLTAEEMAVALGAPLAAASPPAAAPDQALADKVAALERAEIEAALRRARGVKSKAAQALGLSRPTLDKKIADLGIDLWREPDGA